MKKQSSKNASSKNQTTFIDYIILGLIIIIVFAYFIYFLMLKMQRQQNIMAEPTPVTAQQLTLTPDEVSQKQAMISELASQKPEPLTSQQSQQKSALLSQIIKH